LQVEAKSAEPIRECHFVSLLWLTGAGWQDFDYEFVELGQTDPLAAAKLLKEVSAHGFWQKVLR
jgi:hypothetical protein